MFGGVRRRKGNIIIVIMITIINNSNCNYFGDNINKVPKDGMERNRANASHSGGLLASRTRLNLIILSLSFHPSIPLPDYLLGLLTFLFFTEDNPPTPIRHRFVLIIRIRCSYHHYLLQYRHYYYYD